VWGVLCTQELREVHTKLWSENQNGRNYAIEVGVAVKITLKRMLTTGDTKKLELLKNPTKIEEIQEKKFIDRN